MDLTNDLILMISDYKIAVYFCILITVISFEEKVSSTTITMLVILLNEQFSNSFTETILEFAAQDGIFYKFSWYGIWVLLDLISMYLIYFLHLKLKYRVSRVAYFYCLTLAVYTTAQLIDFIDRATIDSGADAKA